MAAMDTVTTLAPITGNDLRILRLSRRVTAAAVGRAAGWSRSRVSAIEAVDRPPGRTVQRYLQALYTATGER